MTTARLRFCPGPVSYRLPAHLDPPERGRSPVNPVHRMGIQPHPHGWNAVPQLVVMAMVVYVVDINTAIVSGADVADIIQIG